MIGDAKAPKNDKAYALFRAINCYAPAGYNSCGGKDVEPAVRKASFRQLKSGFADTQSGQIGAVLLVKQLWLGLAAAGKPGVRRRRRSRLRRLLAVERRRTAAGA